MAYELLCAAGYFGIRIWEADDIQNLLEQKAHINLGRKLTPAETEKIEEMAASAAADFAVSGIEWLETSGDSEWEGLLDATLEKFEEDWLDDVTSPDRKAPKKDKTR